MNERKKLDTKSQEVKENVFEEVRHLEIFFSFLQTIPLKKNFFCNFSRAKRLFLKLLFGIQRLHLKIVVSPKNIKPKEEKL